MFMISLVPLRITLSTNVDSVVWNNDRPSSTRHCRALKFAFLKETADVIRAEKLRVDEEIEKLVETTVLIGNRRFKVNHKLMFTMIDGKTAQAVAKTPAASSCFYVV